MIEIVSGISKKPALADMLKNVVRALDGEGCLYIGFPIISTSREAFALDALLISMKYGVWTFDFVDSRPTSQEYLHDEMDEISLPMQSSFTEHKELCKNRRLKFSVNPIAFVSEAIGDDIQSEQDYPICTSKTLKDFLVSNAEELDAETYARIMSVVQSVSAVRKSSHTRKLQKNNSRGARLQNLEDAIATLDYDQNKAVVETVKGIQRIRGLAGSGKTIILALKAAHLHTINPDWKIAVTFHTRSLKAQFHDLIEKFVVNKTKAAPNWDNLQIMNAWGGSGGDRSAGVYYNFCFHNQVQCLDYNSAKECCNQQDPFAYACQTAIDSVDNPVKEYNAILIDEAQDLTPSFLRLCFASLMDDGLLVYAYDELQNLNANSLPSPEEIFVDNKGQPVPAVTNLVAGGNWDVILKKCYRNSRPVLTTAHALGFGVYRKSVNPARGDIGLVQMFDSNDLWHDVGYTSSGDKIYEGEDVDLYRADDSSPKWLEEHSSVEDIILFKTFSTQEEHDSWVASQILDNLRSDELSAEDILVINPNPLTTRRIIGPIRSCLLKEGVATHLVGVDSPSDVFFKPELNSVAFSGVFRAKGNEAGMVYVINAQDCFDGDGNALATWRNRLFTSITRSKCWVRVVGVGDRMRKLEEEFNRIKENDFHLKFKYPTQEQRKSINIVNRDMTTGERTRLNAHNNNLRQIVDDIREGKTFKEDFDIETLDALMNWLSKK